MSKQGATKAPAPEKPAAAAEDQAPDPAEAPSEGEPAPPAGETAPEPKKKKRKRDFEIYVYKSWCKACGICVEFCPKDVLGRDRLGRAVVVAPKECIGCKQCVLRCPDFAVRVDEKPTKSADPGDTEA